MSDLTPNCLIYSMFFSATSSNSFCNALLSPVTDTASLAYVLAPLLGIKNSIRLSESFIFSTSAPIDFFMVFIWSSVTLLRLLSIFLLAFSKLASTEYLDISLCKSIYFSASLKFFSLIRLFALKSCIFFKLFSVLLPLSRLLDTTWSINVSSKSWAILASKSVLFIMLLFSSVYLPNNLFNNSLDVLEFFAFIKGINKSSVFATSIVDDVSSSSISLNSFLPIKDSCQSCLNSVYCLLASASSGILCCSNVSSKFLVKLYTDVDAGVPLFFQDHDVWFLRIVCMSEALALCVNKSKKSGFLLFCILERRTLK